MNPEPPTVVLIGASVRALAGSALRAGLSPYAIDLFADADLVARCPAVRLAGRYPDAFLDAVRAAQPGPWMYTGGLENSPDLLDCLAAERPAWGVVGPSLRAVRDHGRLNRLLREAGVTVPRQHDGDGPPPEGDWLVKPRRGAGGRGIRDFDPAVPLTPDDRRTCYLQERIDGIPAAAVYLGDGPRTRLVGLTAQLVGTNFLGAKPFHYAGSVGPLPFEPALRHQLDRLGSVLGLRGLFGVDGVLRDGTFWPVEVNPRYTASMEVVEFATGEPLLAAHRAVFDPAAPPAVPFAPAGPCVGKGIVYAASDGTFPETGPWDLPLTPVTELPAFADIPDAGTPIAAGQPVLTVLVAGPDPAACLAGVEAAARAVLDALARVP